MEDRRNFLKKLGLLTIFPFLNKSADAGIKKEILLTEFYIAGFKYYDGVKIVNQLKSGDELILRQEKSNEYDVFAIEIYTKNGIKLGYIPEYANEIPFNLLDGKVEIKCRIKDVQPSADTWEMVYCSLQQLIY